MQTFDQVSFETRSTDKWEFPHGYQIQVSTDATTWTTVKTGQGFGWKDAVVIAPQYAQYVRMTQTGNAQEWWSMAEFHVYSELLLNRSAWVPPASSSATRPAPASALDGNLGTRWSTGTAQANGQWYQGDMAQTQTFNRLMLDSGATWAGDYPRGYQVQVSSDGTNWTTVTSGIGTGQSLLIQFQADVARYLKIVQTGTSGNRRSIAELNVYGDLENSPRC